MNFTSQISTTEEQSKKLLALGLKAETADMRYQIHYFDFDGMSLECIHTLELDPPFNNDKHIPAWSLHRLIEMMPSFIDIDENPFYLESKISQGKLVSYESIIDDSIVFAWGHGNLYDSIISCIGQLIKEGHFNKEYLKE